MNYNLLKDPIPGLIRKLAIPTSIGFFFNTMYNVVDTFYAKYLGTPGLAALTIAFPLFFVIVAVGYGLSAGTTAIIATELGADKRKSAGFFLAQSVTLGFLISVPFMIAGYLTLPVLISKMSSDPEVIELATQYLQVILAGAPFFVFEALLNGGLNARGDTRSYRNVLIGGFFLNLIFDPFFLFGVSFLGIPPMGVRGIALATILIQVAGVVYLLFRVKKMKCFEHTTAGDFIPEKKGMLAIMEQGVPSGLNMITMAVGVLIINLFLEEFAASSALAAFGVGMRIEQIALLPVIGLSTAIITLTGQNGGAKKFDRVLETYKKSLFYGFLLTVVMAVLIVPFAGLWMGIFDNNSDVIRLGVKYLRIEMVTFYGYVLIFCAVAFLQGMKRPMWALYSGIYRQILAPLLVFYLFGVYLGFGVNGVWWGVSAIVWSAGLFLNFIALKTYNSIRQKQSTPV
ncbi:MAG: MATE family efflux transporter [Deltaproteobacteria bacterium]|nr:MATE family efflux transporter [Deltaproteobacteria bacterium]